MIKKLMMVIFGVAVRCAGIAVFGYSGVGVALLVFATLFLIAIPTIR